MNAITNSYNMNSTVKLMRSAKESEYEVIFRVTRELSDKSKMKDENYPAFIDALNINQRLWSILSADVLTKSNALPSDLKAKIFYLGEFVQHFSRRVIREKLDVTPLIEVNLSILRGLADKADVV